MVSGGGDAVNTSVDLFAELFADSPESLDELLVWRKP